MKTSTRELIERKVKEHGPVIRTKSSDSDYRCQSIKFQDGYSDLFIIADLQNEVGAAIKEILGITR